MFKNKEVTEQTENAIRIATWYRGSKPIKALGFKGRTDRSWQKLGTVGLILRERNDAYEQAVIAGTLIGEATAIKGESPAFTKEVQLICILRLLSQYCSVKDAASYLINCVTETDTEHFRWFGIAATKVVHRLVSMPQNELEQQNLDWTKIGIDVAEILRNWPASSINNDAGRKKSDKRQTK